jgi:hypothetical protein
MGIQGIEEFLKRERSSHISTVWEHMFEEGNIIYKKIWVYKREEISYGPKGV